MKGHQKHVSTTSCSSYPALADSSAVVVLQVDNDTYHRMLDEYRTAKAKQKDDELKIKQ
jgi:hypothetical protein